MSVDQALSELERMMGAGRYAPDYVKRRCGEVIAQAARTLGETKPDYARACNAAARLLRRAGYAEDARQLHLRALIIREAVFGVRHALVAETLSNLGILHADRDERTEAEPYLVRALAIRSNYRDEEGFERHAITLAQLLWVTTDKGQANRYLDAFFEATQRDWFVNPQRGPIWPYGSALASLATTCLALERNEDVRTLADRALPLFEELVIMALRDMDFSEQLDSALALADNMSPFLSAALDLDDDAFTSQLAVLACMIDLLGRGRELVLRRLVEPGDPDGFAARDKALQSAVGAIANFLLTADENASDAQWYGALASLNAERKRLEREIGHSLDPASLSALRAVLRNLIESNASSISEYACVKCFRSRAPFSSSRTLYAFARQPHGRWQLHALAPVTHLEAAGGMIKAELTLRSQVVNATDVDPCQGSGSLIIDAPFETDCTDGRDLAAQSIIAPLRDYLGPHVQTIFCPTGDVSMLPLGALPFDDDLVADRAELHLVLSLITLLEKVPQSKLDSALLAVYGSGGEVTFPPALGIRSKGLAALPGAEREVADISRHFEAVPLPPKPETLSLLSAHPGASIIHLAGHCVYADRPERTERARHGSALGDAFGETSETCGADKIFLAALSNPLQTIALVFPGASIHHHEALLTAASIAQADWSSCRLAVMSGCSTHAGPLTTSGAAFTIASAALSAGARSVIATLWDVGDIVSELFMGELYRSLVAGDPLRAAFHRAQAAVRKSYPQPVEWAAFILLETDLNAFPTGSVRPT